MDGKTYAYAVVARKDQPGLVLCYEDATGYKEVDNELSLDTLLSGNNFTMEATIIITDGASIINSNDETKKNKTISGTVVETAEKQGWDDNTMQKIKSDGQTDMVCHASELQGQSSVCILYVGRSVYISYNDNGVRGFVVFAVCIIFSYDSLLICTKKHRIHRKTISDHTGNQHDLFNGYHSIPTDKYMGGIEDSRECWSSSAWRRDDGRAC